jgi:maleylpyruvate isomerase
VTTEALFTGRSATYPGGAAERQDSLRAFDGLTHREVMQAFHGASELLREQWDEVSEVGWATQFDDEGLGSIALGRLVALRLTELEVHHGDLGTGYGPSCWSPLFVARCLPLRVAWLGTHHRRRVDADLTVNGRWLFRSDEKAWIVSANGASVASKRAAPSTAADVTIEGAGCDLLAFLLGREGTSPLRIEGDAQLFATFKDAFPGP